MDFWDRMFGDGFFEGRWNCKAIPIMNELVQMARGPVPTCDCFSLLGNGRGRTADRYLYCLIVPNVTPRSRCLRTSTVKTAMGATKMSTPAAICGQGMPWILP